MFDEERQHWFTTHYKDRMVLVYDSCFVLRVLFVLSVSSIFY